MKKRMKKLAAAVSAVLLVSVVAAGIYVSDYYRADQTAASALQDSSMVTVQHIEDEAIAFCPQNAEKGVIFYPGGKVEYTAYAPLLQSLAQHDIVSVVVKMPFNLAVMDINAADGIKESFPEVEEWYMAGHSLGGSMAASYISQHSDEYDGLILLASYSTEDLSATDIEAISIYGSEDMVLNMESYNDNYSNLPHSTTEFIIQDGCHAYFGSYGEQKGDGISQITPQQQIDTTVQQIVQWMENQ